MGLQSDLTTALSLQCILHHGSALESLLLMKVGLIEKQSKKETKGIQFLKLVFSEEIFLALIDNVFLQQYSSFFFSFLSCI